MDFKKVKVRANEESIFYFYCNKSEGFSGKFEIQKTRSLKLKIELKLPTNYQYIIYWIILLLDYIIIRLY